MPKIVDRDEYRRELLLRCRDLFSKKGYAGITMREIARKLKVSTGTLYHYFPTKQAIFKQIFAQEMTMDAAEAISGIREHFTRRERLETVSDHWEDKRDYYHNIVLLAVDFFRSQEDDVSQKVLDEYSRYYREIMAENMDIPHSVATLSFVFIIGLMYHDLLVPGGVDFRKYLDLFMDMAMTCCEAGGPDEKKTGRTPCHPETEAKITNREEPWGKR